jgi:AraC-like DNA-binding protein
LIEHFSFSSVGGDQAAKFEEYARLYANGSDVGPSDDPFHAEVRAWKLDGAILFDRRLGGMVHSRNERVRTDGFGHLILHYVVSGKLEGSELSRFDRAEPGDMVLLDATRPTRTTPRNVHMITASISRSIAEAALGALTGLHGSVVRPPDSLLVGDFLISVVRRAEYLTPGALPHVGRALMDLLAGAWGERSAATADPRRETFLKLQAVDRCIRHRLGERGLSADVIAEDTRISRSSLYRLLEPHGGVTRYVQAHRLEALRARLWRRPSAPLADLAAELGFAGEAHMSRLFSERFGLSPGAYRTAATDGSGVEAARFRWEGWMGEVA